LPIFVFQLMTKKKLKKMFSFFLSVWLPKAWPIAAGGDHDWVQRLAESTLFWKANPLRRNRCLINRLVPTKRLPSVSNIHSVSA
jgi:hypothetical protein